MSYPYSRGDRVGGERNTYFYSEFRGPSFLEAWHESRSAALAALPAAQRPQLSAAADAGGTAQLLQHHENHDRLLQRFEVSKRIYRCYDAAFKAVRESGYDDLSLYILFGAVCADSQTKPAAIRYLNALLKLVDSLISARERLAPAEAAQLAWLIEREREWVQRVAAQVGVMVTP